jgi:transcriptional regulator with XRE-family HTH domain
MNPLLKIRLLFGLTQSQVGDYLQVQQSLVADFERGNRPLPNKSMEAMDEISNRLPEFEEINPSEYNSLFEISAGDEIQFWRSSAEKARNAAELLKKELEKLDQSRLQVARVISFTEKVAEVADSPLGLRAPWWSLQKEKLPGKISKASQGTRQRLLQKIHLLEEEVRTSEENLRFWEGK